MRILGRIPHPVLQISVFANDGRFPVQFEAGGVAQIYRFRQSESVKTFADVEALLDEEFLAGVLTQFREMKRLRDELLTRRQPTPDELSDLPDII